MENMPSVVNPEAKRMLVFGWIADAGQFIRPWPLFWLSITTSYAFAGVLLGNSPPMRFGLLVIAIIMCNVMATVVNDIADIQVDRLSTERHKRDRPIASGRVSLRRARQIAVLFFVGSFIIAGFLGPEALALVLVVNCFSLCYSLKPFSFSGRPISSIAFWVLLCIVVYSLFTHALSGLASDQISHRAGLVFIVAITLYMGVAEIVSKDLRDLSCDQEGGRRTFVKQVGVRLSTWIMVVAAWIGLMFWVLTLHEKAVFEASTAAQVAIAVGFVWCGAVTWLAERLRRDYSQFIAKWLHTGWTQSYAVMQILTYIAFIE